MEKKLTIEEQIKKIKEVFEKYPDDERFIDEEDLKRAKDAKRNKNEKRTDF